MKKAAYISVTELAEGLLHNIQTELKNERVSALTTRFRNPFYFSDWRDSWVYSKVDDLDKEDFNPVYMMDVSELTKVDAETILKDCFPNIPNDVQYVGMQLFETFEILKNIFQKNSTTSSRNSNWVVDDWINFYNKQVVKFWELVIKSYSKTSDFFIMDCLIDNPYPLEVLLGTTKKLPYFMYMDYNFLYMVFYTQVDYDASNLSNLDKFGLSVEDYMTAILRK